MVEASGELGLAAASVEPRLTCRIGYQKPWDLIIYEGSLLTDQIRHSEPLSDTAKMIIIVYLSLKLKWTDHLARLA